MDRERLNKPIAPLQRAPDAAKTPRVPTQPVRPARLPPAPALNQPTPAQLEIQRAQALEVQRQADLEVQRASIQRTHDERLSSARAAQTSWHASSSKSVPMQRAVAEHARSARAARDTRATFIAQRSAETLETLVAQRLELQVRPALPTVQRQADLTLSHVADHYGDKAAVQLARDPERLSSYAGFKNAGAGLVKNFRTPGSTHTMPQLAEAIQRFREPMQRAAVQGAAFAAFGSHPTYPKQLQRALEERDASLNVQREAWKTELEPVAQRLALEEASGESAAGMVEAARGGGQPLPAGVRALLEAKWNTDLSKVCVHTDVNAQLICKKFNAKALTSANNIFFAAGMWNPTSLEGLQLIAHEAWHTVQQAGGLVEKGVDKNRNLELEAQAKGAELSSADLQTASSDAALREQGGSNRTRESATATSTVTRAPIQRLANSSLGSERQAQVANQPTLVASKPADSANKGYLFKIHGLKGNETKEKLDILTAQREFGLDEGWATRMVGAFGWKFSERPALTRESGGRYSLSWTVSIDVWHGYMGAKASPDKPASGIKTLKDKIIAKERADADGKAGPIRAWSKAYKIIRDSSPNSSALRQYMSGEGKAKWDAAQVKATNIVKNDASLTNSADRKAAQFELSMAFFFVNDKKAQSIFVLGRVLNSQSTRRIESKYKALRDSEKSEVINQVKIEWEKIPINGLDSSHGFSEDKISSNFVFMKFCMYKVMLAKYSELSPQAVSTSQSNPINRLAAAWTPDGANMRDAPNGKEIAKYGFGDRFLVLAETNQWYKVRSLEDNVEGWIANFTNPPILKFLPEPAAKLQMVKQNDTASNIIINHYPNADGILNRARRHFLIAAVQSMNPIAMPRIDNGGWDDVKVIANNAIWLPSEAFANTLQGKVTVNNSFSGAALDNMASATNQTLQTGSYMVKAVIEQLPGGKDVLGTLSNIGSNASKVFDDPEAFVNNLTTSFKNGFTAFGNDFGKHLGDSFVDVLTGNLGGQVNLAQVFQGGEFKPQGALNMGLELLGITPASLIDRIPGGAAAIQGSQEAASIFKDAQDHGVGRVLQQHIPGIKVDSLKDSLLAQLKSWAQSVLVKKALEVIASSLIPGVGIVQAAIKIYETIMYVWERFKQIAKTVQSFTTALKKIANGDIGGATSAIVTGLVSGLSVAVGFFFKVSGLGGIADRVKLFFQGIKKQIEAGIQKFVAFIKGKLPARGGTKPNASSTTDSRKAKSLDQFRRFAAQPKFGVDVNRILEFKDDEKSNDGHDGKVATGLRALEAEEQTKIVDGKISLEEAKGVALHIQQKHTVFTSLIAVKDVSTNRVSYNWKASSGKHRGAVLDPKHNAKWALAPGGFKAHEGDVIKGSGGETTIHLLKNHGSDVTPDFLRSRLEKSYAIFEQERKDVIAASEAEIANRVAAIKRQPQNTERHQATIELEKDRIRRLKTIKKDNWSAIQEFLEKRKRTDATLIATKFKSTKVMEESIMTAISSSQTVIDAKFTSKDGLPQPIGTKCVVFHRFQNKIGIGYKYDSKMQITDNPNLIEISVVLRISDEKSKKFKVETAYPKE